MGSPNEWLPARAWRELFDRGIRTPRPIDMTRRTRAREIALQVLYQLEQNPGYAASEVERFIERRLREPRLREFARELIAGVQAHQPRIDSLISDVAENWRLDRMAAIDRNILRLGAFEMLFCPEVPVKVAINEALELAKRYSTAQSSRFVNGILDRLQTTQTEAPPTRVEGAATISAPVEPEGIATLAGTPTVEASAPAEPPVPVEPASVEERPDLASPPEPPPESGPADES
jgi:transcription antitermination protein NusB